MVGPTTAKSKQTAAQRVGRSLGSTATKTIKRLTELVQSAEMWRIERSEEANLGNHQPELTRAPLIYNNITDQIAVLNNYRATFENAKLKLMETAKANGEDEQKVKEAAESLDEINKPKLATLFDQLNFHANSLHQYLSQFSALPNRPHDPQRVLRLLEQTFAEDEGNGEESMENQDRMSTHTSQYSMHTARDLTFERTHAPTPLSPPGFPTSIPIDPNRTPTQNISESHMQLPFAPVRPSVMHNAEHSNQLNQHYSNVYPVLPSSGQLMYSPLSHQQQHIQAPPVQEPTYNSYDNQHPQCENHMTPPILSLQGNQSTNQPNRSQQNLSQAQQHQQNLSRQNHTAQSGDGSALSAHLESGAGMDQIQYREGTYGYLASIRQMRDQENQRTIRRMSYDTQRALQTQNELISKLNEPYTETPILRTQEGYQRAIDYEQFLTNHVQETNRFVNRMRDQNSYCQQPPRERNCASAPIHEQRAPERTDSALPNKTLGARTSTPRYYSNHREFTFIQPEDPREPVRDHNISSQAIHQQERSMIQLQPQAPQQIQAPQQVYPHMMHSQTQHQTVYHNQAPNSHHQGYPMNQQRFPAHPQEPRYMYQQDQGANGDYHNPFTSHHPAHEPVPRQNQLHYHDDRDASREGRHRRAPESEEDYSECRYSKADMSFNHAKKLIPDFTGAMDTYQEFRRAVFDSIIKSNMPPIMKKNALYSKIKGEMEVYKSIIPDPMQAIEDTMSNLDNAFPSYSEHDSIRQRFDKCIIDGSSHKAFQRSLATIENLYKRLQYENITLDFYACRQLLGKMPEDIRKKCRYAVDDKTLTMKQVFSEARKYVHWLREDLITRSAATHLNPNEKLCNKVAQINIADHNAEASESDRADSDEEEGDIEINALGMQRNRMNGKNNYRPRNQFPQQNNKFSKPQNMNQPNQVNRNQNQDVTNATKFPFTFKPNETPDVANYYTGRQITYSEAVATPVEDSPYKHLYDIGEGPNLECIRFTFTKELPDPNAFCPLHGLGHKLIHCYASSSNVRKWIADIGACVKCAYSMHTSRDCPSLHKCYYCKGNHHTAACKLKEFYRDFRNFPQRLSNPRIFSFFLSSKNITAPSRNDSSPAHNSNVDISNTFSSNQSISISETQTNTEPPTQKCITPPSTTTVSQPPQSNIRIEIESSDSEDENETPTLPKSFKEILTPQSLYDDAPVISPQESIAAIVYTLEQSTYQPEKLETAPEDITLPFAFLRTPSLNPILALVDTGASISLISHKSAESLGLEKVQEVPLSISAFGHKTSCMSTIYKLTLLGEYNNYHTYVAGVPELPNTKFSCPRLSKEDRSFLKAQQQELSKVTAGRHHKGKYIDMILGNDIIPYFIRGSHRVFLPSGRYIEFTPFAAVTFPSARHCPVMNTTTITSNSQSGSQADPHSIYTLLAQKYGLAGEDLVADLVLQMWQSENCGVESATSLESDYLEEHELLKLFKETLVVNEKGEVEVALPWNGKEARLGNNRTLAYRRLLSLIEKIKREPRVLQDVNKIIQEQLAAGIIELVTPEMKEDGPEYFAPQSAVFKPGSQYTKTRIVGDSSSHVKNQLSVNDCLYDGPNMLKNAPGLYLRHRINKFAITSDIAKAFHQVRLQKKDRNVTKWLWVKDINSPPTGDNLIEYRFTRLPFGMRCSPFLLAATIRHYLLLAASVISREIDQNLYVDNILVGTNSEEEVMSKISEIKSEFKKMNMTAREFSSNYSEGIASLPQEDKTDSTVSKFLGYLWDTEKDTIGIKLAEPPTEHPTKRDIASFLARNFDPMGYTAPLHVLLKNCVQKAWENDVDWNRKVPAKMLDDFEKCKSMYKDSVITIPRTLRKEFPQGQRPELMLFCDASKHTYACALYTLYRNEDGSVDTQLIGAKSKVRPSSGNGWSIPRLELLAVDIGIRFARSLIKEFPESDRPTHLDIFSDSMIALFWILTNEQKKAWVNNRVTTIHETEAELKTMNIQTSFHHVRSEENPADLATRGVDSTTLQSSSLWFQGPSFLQQPRESWTPRLEGELECPEEDEDLAKAELVKPNTKPRIRQNAKTPTVTVNHFKVPQNASAVFPSIKQKSKPPQEHYTSFVPFHYTNKLSSLVNITSMILKFAYQKTDKTKINGTTLSLYHERQKIKDPAEKAISIRRLARQIILLEHYREAESRGWTFKESLRPFKADDGLWRAQRNIQSPTLPVESTQPILIHSEHRLAKLLVTEIHQKNGHLPYNYLVTATRTMYCIKKDGKIAQSVLAECVQCKKVKEYPYKYPYTNNLHLNRITSSTPFERVGLDYAGPIEYKPEGSNTVSKAYFLIYTCLTTRCTHLEVVPDQTTRSYILALHAIFSQRGVPRYIYSDNARTFKLGHDILEEDIESYTPPEEMICFLADKSINFKYITPLAPWQGGVYERIVGLAKKQFRKQIGKLTLSFSELHSVLKRVEAVINSRPLIRNSTALNDVPVIRPIDFLLPSVLLATPTETDSHGDSEGFNPNSGKAEEDTRRHLANIDRTLTRIWKIWISSYLLTIRENSEKTNRFSTRPPTVGQVVLVMTENIPRFCWPLGRITEILGDGPTRSVKVLFKDYLSNQVSEKVRAVNQLIPLEIDSGDENLIPPKTPTTDKEVKESSPRPTSTQDRVSKPKESPAQNPPIRSLPHRKARDAVQSYAE